MAIADWATWRLYEVGNPQKQQRGMQYRNSFALVESRLRDEGGKDGQGIKIKNWQNIY